MLLLIRSGFGAWFRAGAIALAVAANPVGASGDAAITVAAASQARVRSAEQRLTATLKAFKDAQARRDQVRASGATRQQIAAAEEHVRALQRDLRTARAGLREARQADEASRPAERNSVKSARTDTTKARDRTTASGDPIPAQVLPNERPKKRKDDTADRTAAAAARAEILREKERLRAETAAAQAKSRQEREALAPLKQESSRLHAEARAAQEGRRRDRDAQRAPAATAGSLKTPAPPPQARPLLEGQ